MQEQPSPCHSWTHRLADLHSDRSSSVRVRSLHAGIQATIPDILKDEQDYTNALSLSRLAYDLENLLSPVVAAILIGLVGYHWLFSGHRRRFLVSAGLVLTVTLPAIAASGGTSPWRRISQGMRIYLQTPRLQGLFALNLTVAAAGAIVIVNSIVIVKGLLDGSDADLALHHGSLWRRLDGRRACPSPLASCGERQERHC